MCLFGHVSCVQAIRLKLLNPHRFIIIISTLILLQACSGADDNSQNKTTNISNACHDDFVANGLAAKLDVLDPSDGGQYYDQWWLSTAADAPTSNHPLWDTQTSNTLSGAETWRCKECHGWDYKGDVGAYNASSEHYSGFPGILSAQTKSPADVYCAIKEGEGINALHKFNADNTNNVLNETRLLLLTRFITAGSDAALLDNAMKDPAVYVDQNGIALGDANLGAAIYHADLTHSGCVNCHGVNGQDNLPAGTSLGDHSNEDPWEVVHKIRFGNPGLVMPAYTKDHTAYELSESDIKNVLAYTQTIPSANPGGNPTPVDCATDTGIATMIAADYPNASASRGGALYDNWWMALGYSNADAPSSDHPLWSSADPTNTASGSETWRCKECHGWDYKGKDGNYGAGSPHYTGFAGVLAAKSNSAQDVFCAIRYGSGANVPTTHIFNSQNSKLLDSALLDLTKFILDASVGAKDMGAYIDAQGAIINANSSAGATLFTGQCALCHGVLGNTNAGGATLKTIANSNPWEMMHKIRYGHPGSNPQMPAYVTLNSYSDGDFANVIAYAQGMDDGGTTTPPPTPVPSETDQIVMGGLLYDHWIAAKQVSAPAGDNPLWAVQSSNTRTGADTWRCKECHGWDYKGKDGQYRLGSTHYTGFKGVYAIGNDVTKSQSDVFNVIKYGIAGSLHAYGNQLSDSEIQALALFIKKGLIDTDLYISPSTGEPINADTANGQLQYASSVASDAGCAACHGSNGQLLNLGTSAAPIALGSLARSNPWEVLHKARFGQPGTIMPSTEQKGLPITTLVDVLGYIRTLPDFP